MSFFDDIEHWFTVFEEDVIAIILKIRLGIKVLIEDVNLVLNWIENNVSSIAKNMQLVESIIVAVSPTPAVMAAIATANSAMIALNAYAQAHAAGLSTVQSAVDGYTAYKQAQAAAAAAVAIAASDPASTPVGLYAMAV
jgi:hypothetical protein